MTKKTVLPYSSLSFFHLPLLLLVLLLVACNPDQKIATTIDQLTKATAQLVRLEIDNPFETISVPSEELIITNPTEATSFQLKSGGYINVPSNAFQKESGEVIATEVKLVYKNYQTVSEIITSGVPMKVANKDGTVDWMQTGGMFEIQGYSNDQPVQLATDKPIEVSLVSATSGNFDVWEFDEAAGNWESIAQNAPATKEVVENKALETEINQLHQATVSPPVNPDNKGVYKLLFNDLDVSKCPKLNGNSPIALVYIGKDATKDPKSKSSINTPGVWYKKELKPLDAGADTYTLRLFGDELYEIPVRIALQGAELEAAKARYQILLTEHQQKLQLLKDKEEQRKFQHAFRRTIRANNMGIYNHDIRYFSEATSFIATFDFGLEGNQFKDMVKVYFITENNTVVVSLNGNGTQRFRYYPNGDNKLIAVLPGNLIATFSESDFEREAENLNHATVNGETYVFYMNIANGKMESVEDLQAIIEEISDGTDPMEIEETIANKENTTIATANQVSPTDIQLYPNPVRDLLNVELTGLVGQRGQIFLNNQMGQRVKEMTIDNIAGGSSQLEISTLNNGTYFLTVFANGDFITTKTIVKL